MDIAIIEDIEECARLKDDWNEIVAQEAASIHGMGVTETYDWAMAVWRNDLAAKPQTIIALRDGDRVVGILPCYRRMTKFLGAGRRELAPLTELYSGRCGFLLRSGSPDHLRQLLRFLHAEIRDWDRFSFTLVDDSASDRAFRAVSSRENYPIRKVGTYESPFISLSGCWERYFNGLRKQFRYNLRSGDAKLTSLGSSSFKIYRQKESVGEFLQKILEIERSSWKETAGSSVTAEPRQENFYKIFTPIAAENGWLRGAVLELDGVPIAYNYGLMFEGICCCLKTSYSEKLKSLGPAQITMYKLLKALCATEDITAYDWMGRCEPFKMRWTSLTYTRTHYIMYRKNLRGRLELLCSRIN